MSKPYRPRRKSAPIIRESRMLPTLSLGPGRPRALHSLHQTALHAEVRGDRGDLPRAWTGSRRSRRACRRRRRRVRDDAFICEPSSAEARVRCCSPRCLAPDPGAAEVLGRGGRELLDRARPGRGVAGNPWSSYRIFISSYAVWPRLAGRVVVVRAGRAGGPWPGAEQGLRDRRLVGDPGGGRVESPRPTLAGVKGDRATVRGWRSGSCLEAA